MSVFIAIVGAILAIFIIIVLHEMGHFWVARLFGIKILRFSIGFGKALYKWHGKSGTEYVLALVPLGGYVKMLGESEAKDLPEQEQSAAYHNKPLLVRMAVVLAGPLVNFILAFFVFWLAFMVGSSHLKPLIAKVTPNSIAARAGIKVGDQIIRVDGKRTRNWQQVMMALVADIGNAKVDVTVKSHHTETTRQLDLSQWRVDEHNPQIFKHLGMIPETPHTPPVVKKVIPNSPAANAGIKPFEEIFAFNGKHMTYWQNLVDEIRKRPGQRVTLTVGSTQRSRYVTLVLGKKERDDKTVGYLGVTAFPPQVPPRLIEVERYNPLTAVVPAADKTALMFAYNAIFLGKLLTAKLSMHTVGGPISIFQAAGHATKAGWYVYLSFIGFISVTVGFINLLPVPGLDGGHLLFQIIEGIIGRPVPLRIQQYGLLLGMLLIFFIIAQATINDVRRIFWG